MPYVLVDPESTLDWQHDWQLRWLAEGATITSRQWTISPLNGTSPETPTLTGDTSDIVFVTGFQLGKVYRLTERVMTDNGLTDERTIVIRCEHQ